jgi:hypothetical protein
MIFDDLEEAQKVYNEYAWKLGFGTHIGNTKLSTAKNVPSDTILNRVFECVHTGKPAVESSGESSKKKGGSNILDATNDITGSSTKEAHSKQPGEYTESKDKRKQNKLLRHECKAHMLVGRRNGLWTVTVFMEQHTHPMVKQFGKRRYYRSHRKVPEEDFQFLQTLHNQNICTAKIMGCLGSVHGGDLRCLPYVKKDVSNI